MDARRDARITGLIADARARGVTALKCKACGYRHSLRMLGEACNAAHVEIDGEACGCFDLTEVGNPGDEVAVTRAKAGVL